MITITANDILASTSYVTEILTDLKPIINLLAGLWIAFWVIPAIIKIAKLLTERDDDLDEWFYDDTGLVEKPKGFETSFTEEERADISANKFVARLMRKSKDPQMKKDIEEILND